MTTASSMTRDELIKFVFDNVRNVLICVSVVTAAGAMIRFRADLPGPAYLNEVLGMSLAIAGMGLLSWNIFHGTTTIGRQFRLTRWRIVFVILPVAAIYASVCWAAVAALVRAQPFNRPDGIVTQPSSVVLPRHDDAQGTPRPVQKAP